MDIRKTISKLPREVKVIAVVLVVGLSFFYLGSRIVQGLRQVDLAAFRPHPIPLVLSLLLFMTSNWIGGWCWSLILDSLGQRLSRRESVKVHLSANIAKYLPGYAWQIMGKAYLTSRQGLDGWLIGVGIALELACLVLTGLWVAGLTLPAAWLNAWGIATLTLWRVPGMTLLTVLLVTLPWLLQRALQRFAAGRRPGAQIHARPMWLMLALMVSAWFILGLALYTCTTALYPPNPADLFPFTFSWATSSILSLAVIFVPTGIGVKEGALAFLLEFRLPMAMAAVVAILTRVISILSEALCFWLAQRL